MNDIDLQASLKQKNRFFSYNFPNSAYLLSRQADHYFKLPRYKVLP